MIIRIGLTMFAIGFPVFLFLGVLNDRARLDVSANAVWNISAAVWFLGVLICALSLIWGGV